MRKLQIIAVAALVLGVGVALTIWQQQRIKQIEAENTALKIEKAQLQQENQSLTDSSKSTESLSQDDLRDLMRLRAKATWMSEKERENVRLKFERDSLAGQLSRISYAANQVEQTRFLQVKTSYLKQRALALLMYADDNNGRLPANLADAATYLGSNALQSASDYGIQDNQIELVYHGSLENMQNPGQMILVKDKQATRLSDGRWAKAYLFCDAHTQFETRGDSNFDDWEKEHTPSEMPIPVSP